MARQSSGLRWGRWFPKIMRVKDSVWQGCFGYWQPLFIQENLLPLGHAAWQGWLTQGRGVVVCDLSMVDIASVDWSRDLVQYTLHFIAESQVPAYLRGLAIEAGSIPHLLSTVQTYRPEQDMLLLMLGNGQTDIQLLKQLALTPPECYRQVRHRWDEFTLPLPMADGADDDA